MGKKSKKPTGNEVETTETNKAEARKNSKKKGRRNHNHMQCTYSFIA